MEGSRHETSGGQEVVTDSKVGLSLSFCVSDVLTGSVREDEISKIITGTCAVTSEDIDELIAIYKITYWSENPDEGEAIARRLFENGKIEQPRVEGKAAPNPREAHWIESEPSFE